MQRRGYPRTPLERGGQVNWRNSSPLPATLNDKGEVEPDCSIFVSKRKGFGTTGNNQSDTTSANGIKLLLESFPADKFYRYKVNIYLKASGASATRRAIRFDGKG